MFQLLKVRRARRAAIATIHPLVERSRWKLHGIPEAAWLDPYMIGFMSMLITLVAQRASNLGEDALGLVQLEAWKEITQCEIDDIGGEICLLSTGLDNAFQNGCDNAIQLFDAMRDDGGESEVMEGVPPEDSLDNGAAAMMWTRMFDDRIRNIA